MSIITKEILETEWLTIADLKDVVDIAIDTQAKYRSEKSIPFYKIGTRVMYRASEINDWLLSHKVA